MSQADEDPGQPAYTSPLHPPADLHLWPEEFASIYLGHLSLLHSIMANPQATPASLFAGYQVPAPHCCTVSGAAQPATLQAGGSGWPQGGPSQVAAAQCCAPQWQSLDCSLAHLGTLMHCGSAGHCS